MTCSLFMPWKDKVELRGVVNGVEDREDGTAGVSEDVLHAVPNHHLVKYLTTGQSNEGVVQWLVRIRS